jgi:hypothetical protein
MGSTSDEAVSRVIEPHVLVFRSRGVQVVQELDESAITGDRLTVS